MAKVRRGMRRRLRFPTALLESPFELLIAALCVLGGVPLLITGAAATPNSLDDLLPAWVRWLWAVSLVVGGLLTLVGRLGSHWYSERAGLALLGGASTVYAIALFAEVGLNGTAAGATYLTFAVCCVIRYWVIGRALSTVEQLKDWQHQHRDAP